ncbi:hypothetical protein [Roseivivax isoporae]|uniref:Glyceraldehyde-3-phosphate dehydrogenase n=1 Tax=Roseivivax isoporae LMG 25204 TaxID=1449351 RepID=X7F608_9RHOB|nr:hypothetical protein [Roseivivax isoporae]ETX28362.1 glyceraldehyde-3-phosphate dehydrogenase [Roseivivax isoporae LMG 25204]
MTNTIALVLGLMIAGGIAYDAVAFDGAHLLFLARKGYVLIDWVAFWR